MGIRCQFAANDTFVGAVNGPQVLPLRQPVFGHVWTVVFCCSDLKAADWRKVGFNLEIMKFLALVVEKLPASVSEQQWDFILCSLVSWVQVRVHITKPNGVNRRNKDRQSGSM